VDLDTMLANIHIKQCAWCLRLKMPDGSYVTPNYPGKAMNATHGICPDCVATYFPEITFPEEIAA
jgi:hypothetical protein